MRAEVSMVATLLARCGVLLLFAVTAFSSITIGDGGRRGSSAAAPSGRNAWRGIVPLQSTAADVGKLLAFVPSSQVAESDGPFKVDGGEVTFYYMTADHARLYHAPVTMVGRVFSIYFKRNPPLDRVATLPARGFKRCLDDMDKRYYYQVSLDGGLAYQVRRNTDEIEYEIYQPLHAEIQKLRLNAACVF
jgi:hypothetical protein